MRFSRRRTNSMGALTLDNVISLFGKKEPGEANILIDHKVDDKTLLALAAIVGGGVLLNKLI